MSTTELSKTRAPSFRLAGMAALRTMAITVGVALTSVIPAIVAADSKRATNEAAGNYPNMDPGVIVVMAVMFAVPIAIAVLLVELTRCWVYGQKPLSGSSCIVLGALAAWPIGLIVLFPTVLLGYIYLFIASLAGVVAFYLARRAWLARRDSADTARE